MTKRSAGLLLFRRRGAGIQVFLVHMGGPFWEKKDAGAWSLPKGEYAEGEDPLTAAIREFEEETGIKLERCGDFIPLGEVKQTGGKVVTAWALERDVDAADIRSNFFEMEWPPKSGRLQRFPEADRADWFTLPVARQKIVKGQVEFLTRLVKALEGIGA